ncbi:MAG: hypothetical protein PVJ92_00855 [Candidatus Dependentiae bacterium]
MSVRALLISMIALGGMVGGVQAGDNVSRFAAQFNAKVAAEDAAAAAPAATPAARPAPAVAPLASAGEPMDEGSVAYPALPAEPVVWGAYAVPPTATLHGAVATYREQKKAEFKARQEELLGQVRGIDTQLGNLAGVLANGFGTKASSALLEKERNLLKKKQVLMMRINMFEKLIQECDRLPERGGQTLLEVLEQLVAENAGTRTGAASSGEAQHFFALHTKLEQQIKGLRFKPESSREGRRERDKRVRTELHTKKNDALKRCAHALIQRFDMIAGAAREEVTLLRQQARGKITPDFRNFVLGQLHSLQDLSPAAVAAAHADDEGDESMDATAPVTIGTLFARIKGFAEEGGKTSPELDQANEVHFLTRVVRELDEALAVNDADYLSIEQQQKREALAQEVADHFSDKVMATEKMMPASAYSGELLSSPEQVKYAQSLADCAAWYAKTERGATARMRMLQECAEAAARISTSIRPVMGVNDERDLAKPEVRNAVRLVTREVGRLDNTLKEGVWAWLQDKMASIVSSLSQLPHIRTNMRKRFDGLTLLHNDAGFIIELVQEGLDRFAPGLMAHTVAAPKAADDEE